MNLITDFTSGIDTIVVGGAALGAVHGETALAFGTTATQEDDRILFDAATGTFRFDVNGAGGVDAAVSVSGCLVQSSR